MGLDQASILNLWFSYIFATLGRVYVLKLCNLKVAKTRSTASDVLVFVIKKRL